MDNLTSNRINAIRATIQFCDANTIITSTIPAFATVLTAVKNNLALINPLEQIALGTSTGVTLDTNRLRQTMTKQALKCSNATVAYANSVNNNTLKAQVDYSPSDFTHFKKEEVADICQTIHDVTSTNISNAQNFGVLPSDVTNLQTTINLYRTSIQNPRQIVIQRTDAIAQIRTLTHEILQNQFKGLMDKMVETLVDTQPSFVHQYKSAREIIDLGSNSPNPPVPPAPIPTGIMKFDIDQTVLQPIFPKIAGNASATGIEQLNFHHGDGFETLYTLQNGNLIGYSVSYNTAGIYHAQLTEITPGANAKIAVIQFDNCKLSGTLTIPSTLQAANIEVPMNPLLLAVNMQQASYANLLSFVVFGCGLLSINENLIGLDNSGKLNGFANLSGGTNAAPSGLGIAAKNSLIAKGWTVITN